MDTPSNAIEIQFRLHDTGRRPPAVSVSSDLSPSGNGRLPRVTQILSLAIYFQDMLVRGDAIDYADLARLGCVSRERMSQVMQLIWLSPRIQREILEFPPARAGRFPISEAAVRRIASTILWAEQEEEWKNLQARLRLDS